MTKKKFLVAMRSGETPVHIPNTTVKTRTADDTMLETAWESRWLPDYMGLQLSRLERTPDKREVGGSSPLKPIYGGVAQLGEHLPCKQGVMSSNLTVSTDFQK